MIPTAAFDYDQSDVSRVYNAARSLPPDALATWRAEIAAGVPAAAGKIATVVDAGCGTGRFSTMLAEVFDARVVGLDPSEKMLAQARSGAAASDPRCSFDHGSLEAMPVPDGGADLIFLSMVYHHVRDWRAAHREIARVLRPGGVVLIRTPLREGLSRCLWSAFFPTVVAIDEMRLPSAAEVVANMEAGGFRAVGHRGVFHPLADDAESYLAKIRLRGLSGLRMISDEDFNRGVDALERHLRAMPADAKATASAFTESMDLFCFQRS